MKTIKFIIVLLLIYIICCIIVWLNTETITFYEVLNPPGLHLINAVGLGIAITGLFYIIYLTVMQDNKESDRPLYICIFVCCIMQSVLYVRNDEYFKNKYPDATAVTGEQINTLASFYTQVKAQNKLLPDSIINNFVSDLILEIDYIQTNDSLTKLAKSMSKDFFLYGDNKSVIKIDSLKFPTDFISLLPKKCNYEIDKNTGYLVAVEKH